MKKRKVIHIAFFLMLDIFSLQAQDVHFSQYSTSFTNLNPALTGAFDGNYRIHLHSRRQWASLLSNPYFTNYLSFDLPLNSKNNFNYPALGISILSDQAGAAYKTINANVDLAMKLSPFKNHNHQISIGAEIGFIQRSINTQELFFGNQYSSDGGFDKGIGVEANLFSTNGVLNLLDLNAGILYNYSSKTALLNPFIGVSAYHLNTPEENLLNQPFQLPMKINIHGGTKINAFPKLQFIPQFLYVQQGSSQIIMADIFIHSRLSGFNNFLIAGLSYRNIDAAIVHFGITRGRYSGMFSYDLNISPLKTYSNYQGSLEFSLSYILSKPKETPKLTSCPSL